MLQGLAFLAGAGIGIQKSFVYIFIQRRKIQCLGAKLHHFLMPVPLRQKVADPKDGLRKHSGVPHAHGNHPAAVIGLGQKLSPIQVDDLFIPGDLFLAGKIPAGSCFPGFFHFLGIHCAGILVVPGIGAPGKLDKLRLFVPAKLL